MKNDFDARMERESLENAMEDAPNKVDVPAYKRKASGDKDWKVTQKDLDSDNEKNMSSRAGLAKRKKELGMDEGYYLGPEDLPDWTKDALHRVKNGEVRGWEELAAELTGDLGIDDNKADIIAKRVFGYKKDPAMYQTPTDRIDAPRGDDTDDDDTDFINKMRARVGGGQTLRPDDFGAEVGEGQEEGGSVKQIAEVIKSMFDKETGKFPRGETGVVIHIKKEFGDRAGALAERMVEYLKDKHNTEQTMEAIRRLSGLPVVEAKDTVTRDPKTGKVTSWKHEGDWKKTDKKDPRGKVTHASDVARRKTEKMPTESTGDYSAKKAAAGKDIGKPGKNFDKIAKKSGGGEKGKRIAGAVLAKLRKK